MNDYSRPHEQFKSKLTMIFLDDLCGSLCLLFMIFFGVLDLSN
jgi:hypothetical protein